MTRILFFVPGLQACSDGILHAQVLTPASFLEQKGFKCFFVGVEADPKRARQAQEQIQQQYGLDSAIYADKQLQIPYFGLTHHANKVANQAQKLIVEWKPDFIYTRAFYCVSIVNRLAKSIGAVSVLDVRGVAAEETALKRGKGLGYCFLLQKEKAAIKKADHLCCVSQNLKQWIQEQTCRKDIAVIPSCVNTKCFSFRSEDRLSLRHKWSIADDELLFCYSGGLGHWQRIRDVIDLFAEIALHIPKTRFLFLTRQCDTLRTLLESSILTTGKCIVTGCDHNEVPAHLSAADFGVIMRHDNVVNNVASPVKVSEYLACGLPVLLTRGIGDYTQTISKNCLGLMLEEDGRDVEKIRNFIKDKDFIQLRKKAAEYVNNNLSWSSHYSTYQSLYSGQLGNEGKH